MDKTLTSAGVKCYINGRNIGWVTGVQFQENTPRRSIYGIDSLLAYELVPQSVEISGNISVVKMYGNDSLEYRGIVAGMKSIIKERYFTLMLTQVNKAGAEYLIFRADQCSVENQSWQFQPRTIVQGTFSFKGIEAVNATTQTESFDTGS